MKVYLSGIINGSYRAQNIIKSLSDIKIPFIMIPLQFFLPDFRVKLFKYLVANLCFLMLLPVRIYFLALSTHVVVLPMNWSPIVLFEIVLGRMLKKKIIVDFYISLYDTTVNDRKTRSKDSFIGKLNLYRDRLLLNYATKVIFLNNSEAIYYQRIVGVKLLNERISIIPLCVDSRNEIFSGDASNIIPDNESILKICWWGTYIPLHGLKNIINAFSFLKDKKIELYIFGDSEENSKEYQKLIQDLNLSDNVFIRNDLSFANGKLAPFLSNNCDIALGSFGSSEKAKTVLINKLVDALSLGLPCMTMPTKAANEFFKDRDGVIYCDVSPEKIANKILEFIDKKDELKKNRS